MGTVYIVTRTSGDYSDYYIVATFLSKEKAELLVATMREGGKWANCDEYNLDPEFIVPIRTQFFVRMTKDGQVDTCSINPPDLLELKNFAPVWNIFQVYYDDKQERLICYCFADDENHAIKITNEIRVRLIALNRWINGASSQTDIFPENIE